MALYLLSSFLGLVHFDVDFFFHNNKGFLFNVIIKKNPPWRLQCFVDVLNLLILRTTWKRFRDAHRVLRPPFETGWLAAKTVYHRTICSTAAFHFSQLLAGFPFTLHEAGSVEASEVASAPGWILPKFPNPQLAFLPHSDQSFCSRQGSVRAAWTCPSAVLSVVPAPRQTRLLASHRSNPARTQQLSADGLWSGSCVAVTSEKYLISWPLPL